MGESIFEFGERLGYESPFGNWLKVDPIVTIQVSKIEEVFKKNKPLYVIHFNINSNINISNATLSLLTANERTGALDLSKKINISKILKPNPFTISIYKDSFDGHAKNSAPDPLSLYLQLEHADLLPTPIVSERFLMKALEITLSGLKTKWVNSDKKTKSGNDLLSFSFVVRTVNSDSDKVGVRMVQDLGKTVDEFLPERYSEKSTKENPPKLIPLTGSKTIGTIGVYRKVITERSKKGGQFFIQAYLNDQVERTQPLNFEKEFSDEPEVSGSCGIEYRNKIECTRYSGKYFGPVYWGNLRMEKYSGWDEMLNSGAITKSDKKIIVPCPRTKVN